MFTQPPMEEQSEREERTEEPPQKAQEDKIRRSKQKELPQQQKVSYKITQKFKKTSMMQKQQIVILEYTSRNSR